MGIETCFAVSKLRNAHNVLRAINGRASSNANVTCWCGDSSGSCCHKEPPAVGEIQQMIDRIREEHGVCHVRKNQVIACHLHIVVSGINSALSVAKLDEAFSRYCDVHWPGRTIALGSSVEGATFTADVCVVPIVDARLSVRDLFNRTELQNYRRHLVETFAA